MWAIEVLLVGKDKTINTTRNKWGRLHKRFKYRHLAVEFASRKGSRSLNALLKQMNLENSPYRIVEV